MEGSEGDMWGNIWQDRQIHSKITQEILLLSLTKVPKKAKEEKNFQRWQKEGYSRKIKYNFIK